MKIALFGYGFTAKLLVRAARQAGHGVFVVSREAAAGVDLAWDLGQWPPPAAMIGQGGWDVAVLTLPPQAIQPQFWPWVHMLAARRLLFGTTSIYQRLGDDIAENTPLDPGHNRFVAESDFLAAGGEILRLSGLYGYERNPLYYIKTGRVGYEPRQVNFVHGDDVARAVLAVLAEPPRASTFNLADGQKHTWCDIIERAVEFGYLTHDRTPWALRRPSANVDPAKFLAAYPGFAFKDFWQELAELAKDARLAASG